MRRSTTVHFLGRCSLLGVIFFALSAGLISQIASAQSEPQSEPATKAEAPAAGSPAPQEQAVVQNPVPEQPSAPQQPPVSELAPAEAQAAKTPEVATPEVATAGPEDEVPTSAEQRLAAIEKLLGELTTELKSSKQSDASKSNPATSSVASSAGPQTRPDPRSALPRVSKVDPTWLEPVKWRSIGPANMSGRITDVAIHEQDTSLWWMATASGGLLKSTNHGGSMEHFFDKEQVVSIGSIATDPTNKDVLWVGTGEINPRNSVSYGNGVYKTVDGGKTFQHMGLDKSYQIARIVVDPKDPNTVYVGAAGRLYGANRERGVYKTRDGGKSWEQVLFIDDRTGVIDMVMHPEDPNTLVVAMWDRLRDGFDSWPGTEPKPEGVDGYDPIRKWGPGGGLYRTSDGGQTWNKLTEGLPTSMTGRIGLDWQSKSPHTLVAIIDCEDIGKGPRPFSAFLGVVGDNVDGQPIVTQIMPNSPAAKAGVEIGDQLVSIDQIKLEHFDQLLNELRKRKVNDRVALKFQRGEWNKEVSILLTGRPGTSQANATIFMGVVGADQDGKVLLQQVTGDGPAEKAGLKAGDMVTSVDGNPPTTFQAMMEELRKKADGDEVKLGIARGEEKLDVTVKLEMRVSIVQTQTPAQSNIFIGIRGEDHASGGALLSTITEDGPAAKAGLKDNDIVKQLDGKEVTDYEALMAELRTRKVDDRLKVKVQRGEQALEVEVVVADRLAGSSTARPYTYSYFGQQPNVQDQQGTEGYKYGGVYKSTDGGVSWQRINSLNTRPMYFSVVKVDPEDEQNIFVLGVAQHQSRDGGVTFTADFGRRVHADGHDLWINPSDGRHMIIGCDGGVYVTFDRGATWDHINTVAIGQFYHVAISPKEPYWVAGGLQDNGSWAGPALSRSGGAVNEDWISLNGGDGFVCRVDPEDPDLFYAESQNGAIVRRHLVTGERGSIRPRREEGKVYRFNWNTPFILSAHNSKIFYSAGNYVFRSLDRGNDLRPISPEITLTQRGSATAFSESPLDPNVLYAGTDDGALWVTRDGGYNWDNITSRLGLPSPRWVATIEASRHAPGRVYVCLDAHRSDDDSPYIFISDDFGQTFKPLHESLPWGSTRCLREDLVNPNLLYLGTEFAFWISIDRGQSWTQFNQNLPTVAVHEVAIHPTNGEIVVATHGRSLWACDVSPLRQLKPENMTTAVAFFDPKEVVRWRRDAQRGGTNRSFLSQNPSSGASLWYALPTQASTVVARIENIQGELVFELTGKAEPGLHMISWNLTAAAPPSARAGGRGAGAGTGTGANQVEPPGEPAVGSGRGGSGRGGRGGGARPGAGSDSDAGRPPTPEAAQETPESADAEGGEGTSDTTNTAEGSQGDAATARGARGEGPRGGGARGDGSASPDAARTARAPQGFQGFRGARPVPSGTYRVQLIVDGQPVATKVLSVVRDPDLPADAVADEVYELQLLLEQQAKEFKFHNKTSGYGSYGDD